MKKCGLEPFNTINDALMRFTWYQTIRNYEMGIRWGITLKKQGIVIGRCGFHNYVSQHFHTEVGFELNNERWRKGIAVEAVEAKI